MTVPVDQQPKRDHAACRKASRGQIARIRELSERLLGHADVAFAVAGQPTDARHATLILHALDAAGTPVSADTTRRRRIFAEAWTRLAGRKPMSTTVIIEPPKPDEPWHLWAARHIGLDGARTEQCRHCGGTGTVTVTRAPSKAAVARALLGMSESSNPTPTSIARLGNPRLSDLERIAELIGGKLDDAAEFCRALASLLNGGGR